jgi:hypothetical protein
MVDVDTRHTLLAQARRGSRKAVAQLCKHYRDPVHKRTDRDRPEGSRPPNALRELVASGSDECDGVAHGRDDDSLRNVRH